MAKNEMKLMCDGVCANMDRRDFISKSAMATALLAIAACGGSDLTAPTSIDTTIKISDHPELANVGSVAQFTANGTPIAVVRTDATTFVALSRICTHQGSTVASNGNGFTCPN